MAPGSDAKSKRPTAPPLSARELLDGGPYALHPWLPEFQDPATEQAYLADHFLLYAPARRVRVGTTLVGMITAHVALAVTVPHDHRWLLLGLPLWAALACMVAGSSSGSRRLYLGGVYGMNAMAGLAMMSVANWMVHAPGAAVAVCVLTAALQFANTTTSPKGVALSILPYLALEAWVLHRGGHGADSWLSTLVLLLVFGFGWSLSLASHRAARTAYRQERIIEVQSKTIAAERAKTEAMLQLELSHQVAERSRELRLNLGASASRLDPHNLAPGDRFDARYCIVAPLGAGGMGAVYEVERLTDGKHLALKVATGEVSAAGAARFAREAEIGARIRHPNLIPIVDIGVHGGVPFLVMELASGSSLERMRERFGDPAWALPLLAQITAGLAALHEAGVVHRDLKPANVLLSEDEGALIARISDFGVSRFGAMSGVGDVDAEASTVRGAAALTATGVLMGTPQYMAPEAAGGARRVEAPADMFALGIIAYEMLTGSPPFAVHALTLSVLKQALPAPPPIVRAGVPAMLAAQILECLAADPALRPTARALLASVEAA